MSQQIATITAGALIAAAIALTNHWELGSGGLLDRWTGAVFLCGPVGSPPAKVTELACPPR